MSENDKRDLEIKAYYLAGGNRKSAMKRWGLTTGQLAGISTRLKMYWKRPIENRRNGIEPLSAQQHGPRKAGDRGGGIVNSVKQRKSRDNDSAAPVLENQPDAPLYQAGSMRRQYGMPLSVSTRERTARGYQDTDFNIGGALSPFPEPTKDCPFETIAYIAREEMYEKPFKKTSEI